MGIGVAVGTLKKSSQTFKGGYMKIDVKTINEIKRHASGAMCASIFSIIISLVSIIFALDVYIVMVTERGCL